MSHLLPPFTQILARRPAPNFADGLTTADLGTPDLALALEQYNRYLQALESCGLAITILDADDRYPDGHFVEDPVVIFREVAFLCRSGAPSRRGESERLLPALSGLRVIEIDDPDAYIDGGDVLFCADRVLVGQSLRTNEAGIACLRRALQTVQPDIRVDAVPFSGVLHLKSGLTEIAPNVLIHDPALITEYALDWAEVITLPVEEGYAADVMPVNDTLFLVEGFPTALAIAQRYYQKIITLDMSEFRKMDGGLTCLSLRW